MDFTGETPTFRDPGPPTPDPFAPDRWRTTAIRPEKARGRLSAAIYRF